MVLFIFLCKVRSKYPKKCVHAVCCIIVFKNLAKFANTYTSKYINLDTVNSESDQSRTGESKS